MKKSYIFIVLIIVLITAGGFFYWNAINTAKSPKQNNSVKTNRVLPKEVSITLNKDGFSPNVVTIKVGSAVRWKNISGDKQTVNSDDYPTNQKHKELNFGVFNDGSSVVYVFTKTGTYGYHNQFQSIQTGKIIVTE